MGEFLQSYGFFILIAALMVICHLSHGRHVHGSDDDKNERSRGGGHQH